MLRDDFVLWLPGLEGSISYIAALLVHTVVKVLVDFTGESRNLPLASEAASIKPSSAERGGGGGGGGGGQTTKNFQTSKNFLYFAPNPNPNPTLIISPFRPDPRSRAQAHGRFSLHALDNCEPGAALHRAVILLHEHHSREQNEHPQDEHSLDTINLLLGLECDGVLWLD